MRWGGRDVEGNGCGSKVDEGRRVIGCERGVSGSWREGGSGCEVGGGMGEGGGGWWVKAGGGRGRGDII